jgi:hypothetical protein
MIISGNPACEVSVSADILINLIGCSMVRVSFADESLPGDTGTVSGFKRGIKSDGEGRLTEWGMKNQSPARQEKISSNSRNDLKGRILKERF